mgnify:FL=1
MTVTLEKRLEMLARIDEIDRMMDYTTDEELLKKMAERKKALRTALANL